MKKNWGLWALLLLLIVSLTACGKRDEHLWLKSPGWSRALLLGQSSVGAPVALLPEREGAYALFPAKNAASETHFLRLAFFDAETNTVKNWDYASLTLKRPQQVALQRNADGLRLFWLDGETLWTALLDANMRLTAPPRALASALPLENFVLLPPGASADLLAGGTRRHPGVYALRLNGETYPLAQDGIWVRAMADAEGNLHVLWAVYPRDYSRSALFYGVVPAGADWDALDAQEIQYLPLSTSTRLDALALGVDDTHVYVFWTTNTVSGLEAGTVTARYLTAPLGALPDSAPVDLRSPIVYDAPFSERYPVDLLTGPRLDLQAAPLSSSQALEDFSVASEPSSELVLAYRSNMLHLWRKQRLQVNVLYLDDGEAAYFQPLSFTSAYSSNPTVVVGPGGALYLTWLEKVVSDNYNIYFASTQPQIVSDFATMTWAERGDLALRTGFGLLIGALLAPLAASVWMLAPLFVYLLVNFFRRWLPQSWAALWEYFSLGLALLAFWSAKRATLPGMFSYVPFSAWIPDISDTLGLVLRTIVPVLIVALSVFIAWHYTYRRGNRAALYFLLLYIGVDSLLSMAIYAVLIYGVF